MSRAMHRTTLEIKQNGANRIQQPEVDWVHTFFLDAVTVAGSIAPKRHWVIPVTGDVGPILKDQAGRDAADFAKDAADTAQDRAHQKTVVENDRMMRMIAKTISDITAAPGARTPGEVMDLIIANADSV